MEPTIPEEAIPSIVCSFMEVPTHGPDRCCERYPQSDGFICSRPWGHAGWHVALWNHGVYYDITRVGAAAVCTRDNGDPVVWIESIESIE